MKRALFFAVSCATAIGAAWLVAWAVFKDADSRRALGIAAGVAFAVQMVSFVVARQFAKRQNVMAGWGIGIALRFVVLLLFGFLAVPALSLPMANALVSLAMFLFVSTLIEPLFLKT
jgi:hypothetical protein